jgi:predicted permease
MVGTEEIASLRRATDAVIAGATAFRNDSTILTDAGSRQAVGYLVSEQFFDLFGVPMSAGRAFSDDDFAAPPGTRVILSQRLWRSTFGGDPAVIGRTIHFVGADGTVVGIAPAAFDVPHDADVWLALRTRENVGHSNDGFVRLRPGVKPESLDGRLAGMWEMLAKKYPDQETGRVFTMRPLLDTIVGDLGPILLIAFATTGLVLLLAIVNVANLLLARGATRSREVAIRTALGASRWDLVRPPLAESLLIAAGATAVALPAAYAAVRAIVVIGGSSLPRVEGMRIDPRAFLFSSLVMLVAGLVVGLAPAVTMAVPNLAGLANEGGRGSLQGRATGRMLGIMVVAEVTLAIALVAGAGRLLLSMQHLLAIDPGFTSQGRLAIDVLLPFDPYFKEKRVAVWAQQAEEQLRALGATAVAVTSALPLRHDWDSTTFVDISGRPIDPLHRPNGRARVVSPEFFDVLGMRMAAGRTFTHHDRAGGPYVVVINRAWARRFMPDADPLRERIDPGSFFERVGDKFVRHDAAIVGILEDVPYIDLTKDAEPTVYIADAQTTLLRRTMVITTADGQPERLIPQIRAAFKTLDPRVPVDFELFSDAVSSSLIWPKLGLLMMATFGIAALVLAATGVFGVIAFVTAQRSGEMALRLALGAQPGHVFRVVLFQGGSLALRGLLVGVLLAWWMGLLMGKYVYHVTAGNGLVLGGSALLILAVSLAATLPSALRAASTQPADALKS